MATARPTGLLLNLVNEVGMGDGAYTWEFYENECACGGSCDFGWYLVELNTKSYWIMETRDEFGQVFRTETDYAQALWTAIEVAR